MPKLHVEHQDPAFHAKQAGCFPYRNEGTGSFPDYFPYRAKAMFAFEEIDGVDVCFFGMHVQEYSSECPMPNTRRVYVSYLDSVHFFQPRHLRTSVYHEILIGYLEHVGQVGYVCSHVEPSLTDTSRDRKLTNRSFFL